nr:MAG: replication associated protein [Arizlama virus]
MHKDWCITLNNPTADEIKRIKKLSSNSKIQFFIMQGERGVKDKTPHLQIFIQMKARSRMATVKKLISNRCHIEMRRADQKSAEKKGFKSGAAQAAGYCEKDDETTALDVAARFKFGKLDESYDQGQGARNDLVDIYGMMKDGANDAELLEAHPGSWMRYHAGIQKAGGIIRDARKRDGPLEVHVLAGDSYSGKSYYAEQYCKEKGWELLPVKPNFSNLSQILKTNPKCRAILVDEFVGQYPLQDLKTLLDPANHNSYFNNRYADVKNNFEAIFFTSQKLPCYWYKELDRECLFAIFRRMTYVWEYRGRYKKKDNGASVIKTLLAGAFDEEGEIVEQLPEWWIVNDGAQAPYFRA